jgi:alpha-glucuronidase
MVVAVCSIAVKCPCLSADGPAVFVRAAASGKTMLAKAVAHHTTAAFIRVVGSEFVQKYLGEVRAAGSSSSYLQHVW